MPERVAVGLPMVCTAWIMQEIGRRVYNIGGGSSLKENYAKYKYKCPLTEGTERRWWSLGLGHIDRY